MLKLTNEQKQNIIYLYKDHSMQEIAIIIGVSLPIIQKVIKASGIKKQSTHRRINPQDIINDYLNGFTNVNFLCKKYNCSNCTVNKALKGIQRVKRTKPPITPSDKTVDIIDDLKQMSLTGLSMSFIARKHKVSRQYVFYLNNKLKESK